MVVLSAIKTSLGSDLSISSSQTSSQEYHTQCTRLSLSRSPSMARTNIIHSSKPTEVQPPALETPPPTTEQRIQTIHSQISCQIATLLTNSVRYSNSQNRYYSLLIPCLGRLVFLNRTDGLSDLRHMFLTLANTNMLHLDPEGKRYTTIGSALLWALDNAENAASYAGKDAPLRLMQALSTIVHVVTRLCNSEWGLENCSEIGNHIFDTSNSEVDMLLRTDSAYHLQIAQNSQKKEEPLINPEQDDFIGRQHLQSSHRQMESGDFSAETRKEMRTSYSSLFGSIPDYMHRVGNSITSSERQQYFRNGCLLPLSIVLKDYELERNDSLGRPKLEYIELTYKDGKLFECISIRCARICYNNIMRDLAAWKESSKGTYLGRIEIDDSQHHTVIKLSKKAYREIFPESKSKLLMGVPKRFPGMRAEIRTLVLPSCFVRVQDGAQFTEWPIRKALEMCQHDLYGVAMLEVQFVDREDGTLIMISLMGIVVEKDLLNCDDAIFGILNKGRNGRGQVP